MPRWRAEAALRLVERERMTSVAGVPTQLALMLPDPTSTRSTSRASGTSSPEAGR